jgi:hypothetical protein
VPIFFFEGNFEVIILKCNWHKRRLLLTPTDSAKLAHVASTDSVRNGSIHEDTDYNIGRHLESICG